MGVRGGGGGEDQEGAGRKKLGTRRFVLIYKACDVTKLFDHKDNNNNNNNKSNLYSAIRH